VNDDPDFVVIGLISRPRGVRGEMTLRPITNMPERFKGLDRALVRRNGEVREVTVESVREGGKDLILKFRGVDDRNGAEALKGAELGVRREDVWPVPEDTYYHFDLEGCRVVGEAGVEIGIIKDVLNMPANDVLVVVSGTREILIPAVKGVVKQVDLDRRVVTIVEMEGLLD
jgi:16S rRNA processing protein RimM